MHDSIKKIFKFLKEHSLKKNAASKITNFKKVSLHNSYDIIVYVCIIAITSTSRGANLKKKFFLSRTLICRWEIKNYLNNVTMFQYLIAQIEIVIRAFWALNANIDCLTLNK
ncbi:hypothetical protein BpHYR1_024354 [Brachionus plicatilis]|uniref:Uncharacterized protein n=1 Tax=Brachionus plicatilis TaxID=10195 RepID=A0A3M7QCH0_BRAPC|nr:hypothetical protein BpHYR1_024354 [Brachionus plicatilis]